ncbi:hypothetical protein ACFOEZ_09815 [Tianweitania populi]|uniref:Flagellin C-terminal domain-containing protein n=1 Tax=Tianweitania populi TaxID=1607949 RepID=A0A8J3DYL1_9HYPH|nr:hypothetical protein GCM10016234_17940 [Tianweitania populi]
MTNATTEIAVKTPRFVPVEVRLRSPVVTQSSDAAAGAISLRLKALQRQQRTAIEALSLNNAPTQSILALFR